MRMRPLAGLFLFLLTIPVRARELPQEFLVKVKYLASLPMFVDFPAQAPGLPTFTIGLAGETPMLGALEAMQGRLVKNRPMAIRVVKDLEDLDGCQVLFIASSEHYRLQLLLAGASRRSILTISDMQDFIRMGGMVGLVIVNNKVTFELNQTAARGAALSFGTQLLKLASDVIQ